MGTPSDWVSGERVFGPPSGTFDVDWLVPAVVEQAGVGPAAARAALAAVWAEHRSAGVGGPVALVAPVEPGAGGGPAPDRAPLGAVAVAVLAEALQQYRVAGGSDPPPGGVAPAQPSAMDANATTL